MIQPQHYGPWALIAGGSEGIGLAFARQLAQAGFNLLLLARRPGPLQRAIEDLQTYSVDVVGVSIDLTSPQLLHTLEPHLQGREFGLLICNAGAAHGAGLFLDTPLDHSLKLLSLNAQAYMSLCHRLGRGMRQRRRGGIILLSSLTALAGGAYVAAYSGSKAFIATFAEGLYAELAPTGVQVLGLLAGATETPSMVSSGANLSNSTPMRPEQVAREGLEQLGKTPIWVVGEHNRSSAAWLRSAPRLEALTLMGSSAAELYHQPYPPEH